MNRWISPANGVSTPQVTSTHVRHIKEDTLACPSEIALEAFTLPSMAAACGGFYLWPGAYLSGVCPYW